MLRNHNHNTFIFIRYVRCRPTIMIDMDGETAWTYRGCGCLKGYYFGSSAITGDLSVGENEEGWSKIAMFFTILLSMLRCFLLIVVGLVVYSHWNKNRQTLLLRGREACHHNLYYCRLRTKLH